MTRFPKWCSAVLVLAALAAAAGCEKRPTNLDPDPSAPEGVSNPNARLLVYRNLGRRVMVRDYASTNVDSVENNYRKFAGPETMPVILLFDGTAANSFELFRRSGSGKFEHTSDYELRPEFKYVNAGYETYRTTDPTPGSYSPSSYLARGLKDGVATHESPLTNEGRLTSTGLLPILYNGNLAPFDSLFTVSWVDVPNAAGYWIHIYEKPIPGLERLTSALPSPIAYETAGDLLIAYRAGNNPGGSIQFPLGDPALLTFKATNPLLGHDYLVRISAVDATGHVFAQTPGDLDSVALSPDMRFLAPAEYSVDKTKAFFSLGGVKVARRRPLKGPAGVAGASDDAIPPSGPIQQHVTRSRLIFSDPLPASASRRGPGH